MGWFYWLWCDVGGAWILVKRNISTGILNARGIEHSDLWYRVKLLCVFMTLLCTRSHVNSIWFPAYFSQDLWRRNRLRLGGGVRGCKPLNNYLIRRTAVSGNEINPLPCSTALWACSFHVEQRLQTFQDCFLTKLENI